MMEVGFCDSEAGKKMAVSFMVEAALIDTLLLAENSIAFVYVMLSVSIIESGKLENVKTAHTKKMGSLLKDIIDSTGLPATQRFPISELHRKEKPGVENTDASDTEEDDEEDEDAAEDQDDEGDEDYSGEEGGDDEDGGDPEEEDEQANGEGGSDDDDDDEDGDDEEGDEDENGEDDDEEEEESDEDQPPAKKRK